MWPRRLTAVCALLALLLSGHLGEVPNARALSLWTRAAPSGSGRWAHTATVLPDSQVLVVGGRQDLLQKPVGDTVVYATAERYDPVSDRWRPVAAMAEARYGHTATLLPGGEVLVSGGPGTLGASATVERYDPVADRWRPAAPMAGGRTFHTATLLPTGQVLVVGGDTRTSDGALATAELYDPAADRWRPIASMSTPRYHHTATPLADGTVLVTGGDSRAARPAGTTAERYDPAQDRWLPTAAMSVSRVKHTATRLPTGQVLVTGGSDRDPGGATAELYDPATGRWRPAEAMRARRQAHTATLLPDGQVLVAGGGSLAGAGYGSPTLTTAERYAPLADAWVAAAPLLEPRAWHTATLLPGGQVLVVGAYGIGPGEAGTSVERYAEASSPQACFAETGRCVTGRFLAYWQEQGGLARNGYPLTDERSEILEDGRAYTVQYFERVRLEYHPEHAAPYDVLLGQFGRRIRPAEARAGPLPGQRHFAETGHNLGGRFLAYWQANGGLAQFGYPLTEEIEERLEDGREYTVQYFERARFEQHPEYEGTPYEVLLGQFGRRILAEVDLLTGRFARLYATTPTVRERLGPPTNRERAVPGATQAFERGRMLWLGDQQAILVLCAAPAERWVLIPNTFAEGDPPGGGPAPVPGLYLPRRGFGQVWGDRPEVQRCLGYALTADEQPTTLVVQPFAQGLLLHDPEGRASYALAYAGGGDGFPGAYQRFADPPP